MPDLTQDQLAALAQTGALNREIEAALGRPMTDAERTVVDRARVVWRLKRTAKRQAGPMGTAEKKRAERKRERALVRRACEDPARRSRLERDPAGWLIHYMPGSFPLPFSKGHREMIAGAIRAAKTGTGVAVAAPRGEGKTTILRGVSIYLVATRQVRFPVVAGWTHKAATEAFRLWLRMLHGSAELRADYPELTQPFEESTHAARLKAMTWDDTGTECGADIRATERCIILPDSIAAVASASVQSDVKGLNVTLPSGEILRPDLLLIDDAQDPKRASNPSFVADVVETIEKQWMCLAGPQSRVTTMVACTVAAAGDVSEHFLSRPDFKTIRVARVTAWPDGWAEKGSETRRLWDEWHRELLDGLADGDGGVRGRKFYRANKTALTAGMAVSWSQRYVKKRKDPDALYSAMFDLYRIGEDAFATEYQNAPIKHGATVYELTPDVIVSRTTDRPAGVVPDWCKVKIAATDINPSYGLTWGVLGFGSDQTSAVLGYGIHEMTVAPGATQGETDRAIYEALVAHGKEMAKLPCRPEAWFIDAGGSAFDVVLRFCEQSAQLVGIQATACTGRGTRNYRPYGKTVVGTPREQCHLAMDAHRRKWVAWHADYWREIAQKAWTGSVGAPGSCSLPAGRHREFAEQIAREQLAGKGEIAGVMQWVWHTQPGRHDYGDVMAMAYMGAAFGGIGSSGPVQKKKVSGGVFILKQGGRR